MVSSTTSALDQFDNIVFEGSGQKFSAISAVAGSAVEIVAAVTGSKMRVLALYQMQEGHTNATFKWLSDSTVLTGVSTVKNLDLVLVLPFNPAGWFETAVGESLDLHPVQTPIYGTLVYEEVAAA